MTAKAPQDISPNYEPRVPNPPAPPAIGTKTNENVAKAKEIVARVAAKKEDQVMNEWQPPLLMLKRDATILHNIADSLEDQCPPGFMDDAAIALQGQEIVLRFKPGAMWNKITFLRFIAGERTGDTFREMELECEKT